MNFWRLVRIISDRKWVVVGLVTMTLIIVALVGPRPKITYEAVCQVSPTTQAMLGGGAATNNNAGPNAATPVIDREVVLSNLVLLTQSGDVFRNAADLLALPVAEQQRLHPGLPSYKQITRMLYSSTPSVPIESSNWRDVLEVTPVVSPAIGEKGTVSNVIGIKIKMPNGEDAPFIANAVAVALAETYQQKSHEESRKYVEFLTSSMQDAKNRLKMVDARIVAAKKQHGIVAVDPETQSAVTSAAALQATRDAAQSAVQEASAALRNIDKQLANQPVVRMDQLPSEMNPRVMKLKDELAQAESELRADATRHKPGHTGYEALANRVKRIQDRIEQEGNTYKAPVLNALHTELTEERAAAANKLAAATAKLAAINGQVRQAQKRLAAIPGAQKDITELNLEQQTAADDYTTYAQKLAQSKTSDRESKETGSIILFDPARKAFGPVVDGPRKRTQLVFAFVLSLVLALAASVWLDSIDKRIRSRREAEDLFGLPAMGLIPALEGVTGGLPRLTDTYPLSAAAESYRLLRTQVLYAHKAEPFKTLMVASPAPGQGATTVVCNLAIALAQIGKRVILIDADMRRPSLHRFFGVPNESGLSTMLRWKQVPPCGIKSTDIDNLKLIPAGPPPINPSELLASEHLWEIVKTLEDECDFVLFDAPSIAVFSDGQVLAGWMDAALYVVSAGDAKARAENQALQTLLKSRINVIGTVVNNLDYNAVESCHFYSRYYPTGFGGMPSLPASDASNDTVR